MSKKHCNICDKEVSIPHHHGKHESEIVRVKKCIDSNCMTFERTIEEDIDGITDAEAFLKANTETLVALNNAIAMILYNRFVEMENNEDEKS